MIDSKYATTLNDDLLILEIMAERATYEPKDEKETKIQNMIKKKPNGWRYKLSLIHRVNQMPCQKEMRYCTVSSNSTKSFIP